MTTCSACNKPATIKCVLCNKKPYCSNECKESHWNQHEKEDCIMEHIDLVIKKHTAINFYEGSLFACVVLYRRLLNHGIVTTFERGYLLVDKKMAIHDIWLEIKQTNLKIDISSMISNCLVPIFPNKMEMKLIKRVPQHVEVLDDTDSSDHKVLTKTNLWYDRVVKEGKIDEFVRNCSPSARNIYRELCIPPTS